MNLVLLGFFLKNMPGGSLSNPGSYFIWALLPLRLKAFYNAMAIEVTKPDLRSQGKKLKSFMILIKQKLNRQQMSRSRNFRKLLAIVFDPEEKERDVKFLLGGFSTSTAGVVYKRACAFKFN